MAGGPRLAGERPQLLAWAACRLSPETLRQSSFHPTRGVSSFADTCSFDHGQPNHCMGSASLSPRGASGLPAWPQGDTARLTGTQPSTRAPGPGHRGSIAMGFAGVCRIRDAGACGPIFVPGKIDRFFLFVIVQLFPPQGKFFPPSPGMAP